MFLRPAEYPIQDTDLQFRKSQLNKEQSKITPNKIEI